MTRYADPQRCPDCSSPIEYGAASCTACQLPLHGVLAQQLFATLSKADELLLALRAAPAAAPAPVPASTPSPTPAPPQVQSAPLPQPAAMKGSSVPKILLTLGAGCLLVAALVFLAVAWSVMGVGGRTATLVGITVLSGVLTAVVAKRGLRGAVEALGLVTLGLGALDVFGAESAGWFGDIGPASFAVLLGVLLAGASTAACLALRRTPSGAFTSGEIVGAFGVSSLVVGLAAGDWWSVEGRLVVATLVAAGTVAAADRLRLVAGVVGTTVVTLLSWLALAGAAAARLDEPTLSAVWGDLDAWPALVAAALAAALVAVRRLPLPARQGAASVAAAILTLVVVVPMGDEAATPQALATIAVLAVAAAMLWFVPKPWHATAVITLVASGLLSLVGVLFLGGLGAARLLEAGVEAGRFLDRLPARPDTDVEPWVLVLGVAALTFAAAAVLRQTARTVDWQQTLPFVGVATVVATAALYPLPVWVFVAAALASGVAFVLRDHLIPAVVLLAAGVFVGLHSDGLTAIALGVVVLAGAWVHLKDPREEIRETSALLAQLALAGSVWTWGDLLDRPATWVAAVGFVVLALTPLARRSVGLEVGAAVGMLGLFAAGAETPTWVAVDLTLAGVAVCIHALLREDRRRLAWAGGFLLAAATWVRLADLGVEEPEPYTLPSAIALLVVGLLHLRSHPAAPTMEALGAGLSLALVPSLLWVLVEPATPRAAILGIACLVIGVAGVQLRWSAPLVVAASVGAVVVLRHAAPYVADSSVPRWVLIGFAGALLVAMGVTWEQRVREARAMLGYVRGLR